jgi:hypothetical protein
LEFLAAEIGGPCPALPPVQDPAADLLARIYDEDIEAATRDAYNRDYLGYGFADWARP